MAKYSELAVTVAELVKAGTTKREALAAALMRQGLPKIHALHATHAAVRAGLVRYNRASDSYVAR